MRVFIAVSCFLAVANAGAYYGQQQLQTPTGGYKGPLHVPVIGPNGVPKEPEAVIAARNNHLANFNGQPQQNNQYDQGQYQEPQQQQWQEPQQQQQQWQQPQQYQQQPQQQQWQQPQQQQQQWQQPQQYQQQQHQNQQQQPLPVINAQGVPQDSPDVAAAKAAHFAAYAEANARSAPSQAGPSHYQQDNGQYNQQDNGQYNQQQGQWQ